MVRKRKGTAAFSLRSGDGKAVAKVRQGADRAKAENSTAGFGVHPTARCPDCGAPAGAGFECSVNGEFCRALGGAQ